MASHIKKAFVAIAVVAIAGLLMWWHDVTSDKDHQIEELAPVTLLKTPPHLYPETNVKVGRIDQVNPFKLSG
jgi:hypothetical protein